VSTAFVLAAALISFLLPPVKGEELEVKPAT
jgi:hypothetical protein